MKKFLWLAVVATLVAMLAIACGGQPQVAPTQPPQVVKETVVVQVQGTPQVQVVEKVVTATPVPPTAAPTKPAVGMKDTIVIAQQQEPDSLNPYTGSMMARSVINQAIQSACVTQDDKANWVPILCESVPTLDNGGAKWVGDGADKHLEATLKFKAGIKWHDGVPFTVKDSIFGWKTFMDPDFAANDRTFLYKVYKMEAVDDNTVKVSFMSENQAHQAAAGTLKGDVNFAAFKADYVSNGYDTWKGPVIDPIYFVAADYYMPEHILKDVKPADIENNDWSKSKAIGIGPYKLVEWQPAQQIKLEAVADHILKPKIKTIIFRFITDSNAILAALQNNEIDAADQMGLTTANAPDLDKLSKDVYRVDYAPGYQWEHVDLNISKPPFDNKLVRQALAFATDKQSIVDKLYYGKQKPAYSWVPDFHWVFDPSFKDMYKYDPAKAKDLLTQAGYDCSGSPCVGKDKQPLAFTLVTTDRTDRQALAQVLQAQWKKVGFGVNLQFLYGRGLFATCTSGNEGPLNCRTFQAGMYTWLLGDDPDVSTLYTCKSINTKENGWSGQNYPGYCNKQFDDIVIKAASDANIALDRSARKPLYIQAEKIWLDDAPVIPLIANSNTTVWSVNLKNASGVPTQYGETWNIADWEWVASQ